jgi:hypothetical protein
VTTRGGMAIRTTSPSGESIEGIDVAVLGATDRSGKTNESGQTNFPGLPAGNYRLRFSGERVITFEREVAVRAGQVSDVDVVLNAAEPPKVVALPAPATPPPTAPAPAGPTGHPQALSIVDLLEKEFVGRQPMRESLLSCSGDTRTTMLQYNDPSPERTYLDADSVYYVLGGEGTLHVNGRDSRITTNGFLSVPRGTRHSFERRGNRPLVLLAVRSGEPCDEAR